MMLRPAVLARIVLFASLALFAGSVIADPIRPLLTKENKRPEKGHLEAGVDGEYVGYKDDVLLSRTYTGKPYLRYSLFENFAVSAALPYHKVNWRTDDNEKGIGDAELGFELLPWEDIFHYPWILPHVEFSFPTGDEDKYLGEGTTVSKLGLAAGTVVNDVFHFIVDGRYEIPSKSDSTHDNIASVAGSIIWDISKEFSILAEAKVTDEDNDPLYDGNPVYFDAGLTYKPIENLFLGAYGGSSDNTGEDVNGHVKVAWTF